MNSNDTLLSSRFPRSSRYNRDWITSGVSGGANPLWLAEWLSEVLDLKPGMRVLDLGCGRALSSVFLHREFGLQVWATDLWFNPSENLRRIQDAGAGDGVFPIRADARALPFAAGFFDAIICLDCYVYFGTDDHCLNYLARFLKPGGALAIAGAGIMSEITGEVPEQLRAWWTPDLWCLHSASWWRRHWEKTGILDVAVADTLPDGWQFWIDWHRLIAPGNAVEIQALEADRGRHLGYVRAVGRLRADVQLEEPIVSMPSEYHRHTLLREA